MDRFTGSVAVVTGSNVGIGAAISKELLKKGLIVAGLARREEKLQVILYTYHYLPNNLSLQN